VVVLTNFLPHFYAYHSTAPVLGQCWGSAVVKNISPDLQDYKPHKKKKKNGSSLASLSKIDIERMNIGVANKEKDSSLLN